MLKRMFDVIIATIALAILTPALLSIALLIRLKMGSPVLFCQMRPGLTARPFIMIKFRTMCSASPSDLIALPDSARLTTFGKFLRATSLDELPELWNVLTGDMSLVGPRPLLMEYLPLYNSYQLRRMELRPGITGWAQVNGRNAVGWDEKFALDVWYVDNRSLWLDCRIIWMTIAKVLSRDGISADGETTMPKFQGNHDR